MTFDTQDDADTGTLDYSDAAATFGDRLVLAREAAGMTQAELAKRLGVRPQTLRGWEDDQAEPRANRLQMLAGMLNVSMVWLMSGQGATPRSAVPSGAGDAAVAACLADLRRMRSEGSNAGFARPSPEWWRPPSLTTSASSASACGAGTAASARWT
jgi:transcriptional regulator with XRE-family HTH domain